MSLICLSPTVFILNQDTFTRRQGDDNHETEATLELGDDVQTVITEFRFSEPANAEGERESVDLVTAERRLVSAGLDEGETEDTAEREDQSPSPMKYVLGQTAKEVMQDDARHLGKNQQT